MRIDNDVKLDFKDVLLLPQRSSLSSRSEVELERTYKFPHSSRTWTGIGIIAANMDTTGTMEMAKKLASMKILTALHKFYDINDLVMFFYDNQDIWDNVFYTVGANDKDLDKLFKVKKQLALKMAGITEEDNWRNSEKYHLVMRTFPHMICLDAANGYTENFVEYLKKIRYDNKDAVIMAGNVVTGNMAEELILRGADLAKIGIGGGSACLTRIVSGVGMPQLSAIDDCAFQVHGLNGHICSDGGCTTPGDVVKAMACGADFVMLGGMLSSTDECEGEWKYDEQGNKVAMKFYGMSSKEANQKYNGGLGDYKASEGKCVYVPYKGKVEDVLQNILGGLRSCCTYLGAEKLKHLPKCAYFVKVNTLKNDIYGKD